jgi:hypothetical protein
MANGGFFLANLLSCLHPTPLTLTTPAELLPYGWTAADLWCAPLMTGIYALLTHAQPFWGELHDIIATVLGANAHACEMNGEKLGGGCVVERVEKVDEDSARAICALILCGLFVGRTVKNFSGELKWARKTAPVTKGRYFLASLYKNIWLISIQTRHNNDITNCYRKEYHLPQLLITNLALCF